MKDDFDLCRLLGGGGSRRDFLRITGGAAGLLALGTLPASRLDAQLRLREYPFTLGVASGDPVPDGVVLWTRLAPDPLRGGGMPPQRVPVRCTMRVNCSSRCRGSRPAACTGIASSPAVS